MLYSVTEAARMLSISPWTLRKNISVGRVRVVRLGRRVLLDEAELARIGREGLPSLGANATRSASTETNSTSMIGKEESCLTK